MDLFLSSKDFLWLLFGIVLILLEVTAVAPGIGLLFTGLGALCTALLLYSLSVHDISIVGQLVWFLAFSIFWAFVLWNPIKRWRMSSGKGAVYNNIIGDKATIAESGLKKGKGGQALWSGTRMNARLTPEDAVLDLPPGALVEIIAVEGNTLIVKSL
jgi:membrane protein implicated in regulation of membrane protease activity